MVGVWRCVPGRAPPLLRWLPPFEPLCRRVTCEHAVARVSVRGETYTHHETHTNHFPLPPRLPRGPVASVEWGAPGLYVFTAVTPVHSPCTASAKGKT